MSIMRNAMQRMPDILGKKGMLTYGGRGERYPTPPPRDKRVASKARPQNFQPFYRAMQRLPDVTHA
jgi:hypothetical protein